jgi:hypothetical protein
MITADSNHSCAYAGEQRQPQYFPQPHNSPPEEPTW